MKKPSKVAIHECAHAVLANHMLGNVNKIVIEDGESGYCETKQLENQKNCVIKETLISIAGHEAEVLWCGAEVTLVPADDWDHIHSLNVSDLGASVLRGPLRKFLRANKKTIFGLARELDKRGVLTRRIFLRTFRELTKENE